MGGRKALADVHSKQRVLAERDVELEELGLSEVEKGPPEDSRGDFLGHPPADLDVARVYAAVPARPRPWSEGKRNCIICDYGR